MLMWCGFVGSKIVNHLFHAYCVSQSWPLTDLMVMRPTIRAQKNSWCQQRHHVFSVTLQSVWVVQLDLPSSMRSHDDPPRTYPSITEHMLMHSPLTDRLSLHLPYSLLCPWSRSWFFFFVVHILDRIHLNKLNAEMWTIRTTDLPLVWHTLPA